VSVRHLRLRPSFRFLTAIESRRRERQFTFEEFFGLAEACGRFLDEAGLRSGETVLIVMPQSAELLFAVAGCVMRGVIPSVLPFPNVKFHPDRYREQLRHLVGYLDAQLVLGSTELAPAVDALIGEVVAAASGCRYVKWEDLAL